jgi:hypothetical protein
VFATGRAHCTTGNLTDARPPYHGFWPLSLDAADPQGLLPPSLWQAADAPAVLVTGAWRTQGATAEMFFAGADGVFSGTRRVEFPVIPDGQVRTYPVDLAANPQYTGPISRLRFDPIIAQSPGDAVDLYAITTAAPASTPGLPAANSRAINTTAAPNPFNPGTTISFEVPIEGRVRVDLFDMRGKRMRSLLDASLPSGPAAVAWDGRDDSGCPVASGAYLARVQAGEQSGLVRLMLLK